MTNPPHLTRRQALTIERGHNVTRQRPVSRRPAARRSPPSGQPRPSRLSRRATATMILAGSLVMAQGLPANAVGPAAAAAAEQTIAPANRTPQTMVASGPISSSIVRDSYSVRLPPPPPPVPRPASSRMGSLAIPFAGSADSAVRWPFLASPISSGFGSRSAPCRGCSSNHLGLDFTPGSGTPISAVADGVVRVSRSNSGSGVHVIIDHQINGQQVSTLYAHMQAGSVSVVDGQMVTVGTQVGKVGNTGMSTGAHLHLETWLDDVPVDPFAWLTANVR